MCRTRSVLAVASLAIGVLGCGSGRSSSPPYALQARIGTYDDGSGRAGLAVLATLRDGAGNGPDVPWQLTLCDEAGAVVATVSYDAAGSGSYAAVWRPELPPYSGRYTVEASDGQQTLSMAVTLGSGALDPPLPSLSADGVRIEWSAVSGAAAYLCRVYSGGLLQLEAAASGTSCDVSELPPGAYSAAVLAMTADLHAVAASLDARPPLPAEFHVSEARLGLAHAAGASSGQLRAVGGAYDDGIGGRALAIWLSISGPNGSPTTAHWDV